MGHAHDVGGEDDDLGGDNGVGGGDDGNGGDIHIMMKCLCVCV